MQHTRTGRSRRREDANKIRSRTSVVRNPTDQCEQVVRPTKPREQAVRHHPQNSVNKPFVTPTEHQANR